MKYKKSQLNNQTILQADTPIGTITIKPPYFSKQHLYHITINNTTINHANSLKEAKQHATNHLINKYHELTIFLAKNQ